MAKKPYPFMAGSFGYISLFGVVAGLLVILIGEFAATSPIKISSSHTTTPET